MAKVGGIAVQPLSGGQTVGSRVLLVVPPADGYGAKGSPPIGANETLVFVVEIPAAT